MPASPGIYSISFLDVCFITLRSSYVFLLWICPTKIAKIGTILDSMGCFRKTADEDEKMRKEANKRIEKQLQKDKQLYRATHRLLLLGEYF